MRQEEVRLGKESKGKKRRERESKGKEGSRQELDETQQYMRGRVVIK